MKSIIEVVRYVVNDDRIVFFDTAGIVAMDEVDFDSKVIGNVFFELDRVDRLFIENTLERIFHNAKAVSLCKRDGKKRESVMQVYRKTNGDSFKIE